MLDLIIIGNHAKEAETFMRTIGSNEKNRALEAIAEELIRHQDYLLEENEKDIETAIKNQMNVGLLDRLKLTPERIASMADSLFQIARFNDPIGEVLSMKKRPNGLIIGKKRVPLGVIGIIYESRPNVTTDAFGLCFKSGNVVILKGGSDAIHSNKAIVNTIRTTLKQNNINPDIVQLIEDTRRETAAAFMKMNTYIDVLIPRGGAGLIKAVVENSTIPVIETGTGNCHIYVDKCADLNMALSIVENAKTQRISVCNACESLVVHESVAKEYLPMLSNKLKPYSVELRGDEKTCQIIPECTPATEEDWGTEYLDYILSIKLVNSIDEAITHINKYNTKHSEAIITTDYDNAQRFLNEVDAAAVYVNASTRFTDGAEFGMGAEIGISNQKLHARGPMGLEELTSIKYIIYGSGQIKE